MLSVNHLSLYSRLKQMSNIKTNYPDLCSYSICVLLVFSFQLTHAQNLDSLDNVKITITWQYNNMKVGKSTKSKLILPSEVLEEESSFVVPNRDTTLLKNIKEGFQKIQKSIYGPDDRIDITKSNGIYGLPKSVVDKLSKSVCAIVSKERLEKSMDGKVYNIKGSVLREASVANCTAGYCSNIRYGELRNPVHATGFMISPTKIITVNHALKDTQVKEFFIVFNYTSDKLVIDSKDVYEIGEIVPKLETHSKDDFKILKLNRSIDATKNHKVTFNRVDNIENGNRIFMIGFPSGLPMMIAGDARVYKKAAGFFYSNLDAFSGNSGSPVFNEKGEVEGILKRGAKDHIEGSDKCCILRSFSQDIESASEKETVLRLQYILNTPSYFQ